MASSTTTHRQPGIEPLLLMPGIVLIAVSIIGAQSFLPAQMNSVIQPLASPMALIGALLIVVSVGSIVYQQSLS